MNDDDDEEEEEEEESPALPKRIVRAVELENLLCCKERGRRQHRAVEKGGWRFGFFKKRTNERTNGAKRKRKKDAGT